MTGRQRGSWRRVEKHGPSPLSPPNVEDQVEDAGTDGITPNDATEVPIPFAQGDPDRPIIEGSNWNEVAAGDSAGIDTGPLVLEGAGITGGGGEVVDDGPLGPNLLASADSGGGSAVDDGSLQIEGADIGGGDVVDDGPLGPVVLEGIGDTSSPLGDYTATIDWGDGSSPTVGPVVPESVGGDSPSGGDYTATINWGDGDSTNDEGTVEIGGGTITTSYEGGSTPPPSGSGSPPPPRQRPSGRTLGAIIAGLLLSAGGVTFGLLAASGSSGSPGKPPESPSTTAPLPASVGVGSTSTTGAYTTTTTTNCPLGGSDCSATTTTQPTRSTATTTGASTTTQPTRSTATTTAATTTSTTAQTTTTVANTTTTTKSCPVGAIC